MKLCRFPQLSLIFFILTCCAQAQDFRATISGQIKDVSGAGVPAAKIVATEVKTSAVHTTESSDSGGYTLASLAPGAYKLEVESSGFRRYIRTGIKLQVQERATVDVTLEPGDVQTSVNVNADASLLETSTASRGGVITGRTIVDLPLNGRNAFSLASLEPGVTLRLAVKPPLF